MTGLSDGRMPAIVNSHTTVPGMHLEPNKKNIPSEGLAAPHKQHIRPFPEPGTCIDHPRQIVPSTLGKISKHAKLRGPESKETPSAILMRCDMHCAAWVRFQVKRLKLTDWDKDGAAIRIPIDVQMEGNERLQYLQGRAGPDEHGGVAAGLDIGQVALQHLVVHERAQCHPLPRTHHPLRPAHAHTRSHCLTRAGMADRYV